MLPPLLPAGATTSCVQLKCDFGLSWENAVEARDAFLEAAHERLGANSDADKLNGFYR